MKVVRWPKRQTLGFLRQPNLLSSIFAAEMAELQRVAASVCAKRLIGGLPELA